MKENKSSSNLKGHVKSPKGKVSKAANGASQSKKAVTNGTDKKTGSKELTKKEPKTRAVKPKKSVNGASSAAKRIHADGEDLDDFEDGSVGPAVKKRKVSPEELGLTPLSVREVAQRIHGLHPNIQGSIPAAIELMEEGNTIAFIARYRASRTNNMNESDLRLVEKGHTTVKAVESKRKTVLTAAIASDIGPSIQKAIRYANTVEELEALYEPFKGSKVSLANEAERLGLQPLANAILSDNNGEIQRQLSVHANKADNVQQMGVALAAEILFQERDQKFCQDRFRPVLTSTLVKDGDPDSKYRDYHSFSKELCYIRSHQYLAIARAEKEKCLKVSVHLGRDVKDEKIQLERALNFPQSPYCQPLVEALTNASSRLKKVLQRSFRKDAKERAEEEAVLNFRANLKEKLLIPPLRKWLGPFGAEKNILALDPGFKHGTKAAVIDGSGGVVETTTIWMRDPEKTKKDIEALIDRSKPHFVTVGNGHGGHEVGKLLKEVLKKRAAAKIHPVLSDFLFIDESGASVYSALPLAKQELPDLEINHRSAVSLARRVLDPLAELCKIPPESLSVGMYQHDIEGLKKELQQCVELTVSHVGVDIATASQSLLQAIPGLGPTKAKDILASRADFSCIEDLKKVKGVGPGVFRNISGFLYLSSAKRVLDRIPHIHPDHIKDLEKIQKKFGEKLDRLEDGNKAEVFKSAGCVNNDSEESKSDTVGSATTSKGKATGAKSKDRVPLTQALLIDYIDLLQGRKEVKYTSAPLTVSVNEAQKTAETLKAGDQLRGYVKNIVAFGAFVDCNVGSDCLLHKSEFKGRNLAMNQQLDLKVKSVEKRGKTWRIGVALS